jgi:hypothetical protein
MRNHDPSKSLAGYRILLIGALNWGMRKRARKAWNYRLTDPDAYKNAIKEYKKALRSKNDRVGRISVGRTMAYNHQPDCTEYYPKTMIIRWVLFDFRQEFSPALTKSLHNTLLKPIFQGVN